jgi:uncharacterized protein (DUF427 family)
VRRRQGLRGTARCIQRRWCYADRLENHLERAAMKAVWKGTVVAESDDTVVVEGNHYFPAAALKREYTLPSNTRTMCSWKGQASYLTLFVDGDANPDAVWFYPEPREAAAQIKDRVAFWKGVQVVD